MDGLHRGGRPQRMAKLAAAVGLIVVGTALSVAAAQAASLGKLEIVSGIGEPFRGRIDVLDATRHELDTLGVRLASEEAYRERGMSYGTPLHALRFKLEKQRGGRHYVAVTSAQPFGEPVLDLLVNLAWFGGTTTYSYTALVDPAGSERAPVLSAPTVVGHTTAAVVAHKAKKPANRKVATATEGKRTRGEDRALAEQIRQKEELVEQRKHQLAAAQERISELQRTVQEQQQMLAAVAAETIAKDMRNAAPAPAVVRVSHEMKPARPPVRETPGAEMLLGEPIYLAGGATVMLLGALAFMRRRRRRVGEIEDDYSVEPALRAAG